MDKNKIRQLADYAVKECCDRSEDCHWTVSYDELYYLFGAEAHEKFRKELLCHSNIFILQQK